MYYIKNVSKIVLLFLWLLLIVYQIIRVIPFFSAENCAKSFMNKLAECNFIEAYDLVYNDCNGFFTYEIAQQSQNGAKAFIGYITIDEFRIHDIKYNEKKNSAYVEATMQVSNAYYRPVKEFVSIVKIYLIKKGYIWLIYSWE